MISSTQIIYHDNLHTIYKIIIRAKNWNVLILFHAQIYLYGCTLEVEKVVQVLPELHDYIFWTIFLYPMTAKSGSETDPSSKTRDSTLSKQLDVSKYRFTNSIWSLSDPIRQAATALVGKQRFEKVTMVAFIVNKVVS